MRVIYRKRRNVGFFDSVTSKILIANIIIFILTIFSESTFDLLALKPNSAFNGMFWQFFTFMYVHGNFTHIFFNMFSFIMFGPTIEETMGSKKFFIFYTLCGIFSGIFHIIITGLGNISLVGASGAIFGVVTAYGILFPKNIIYVYFVPMPAIIAIGLFGIIELFSGISGVESGIANFGHLGGMIMGLILVKFFGYGKQKDYVYFWDEDW